MSAKVKVVLSRQGPDGVEERTLGPFNQGVVIEPAGQSSALVDVATGDVIVSMTLGSVLKMGDGARDTTVHDWWHRAFVFPA